MSQDGHPDAPAAGGDSREGLHRRAMKAFFALTPWGLKRRLDGLHTALKAHRVRVDSAERRLDQAEQALREQTAVWERLDRAERALRDLQAGLERIGEDLRDQAERLGEAERSMRSSDAEIAHLRDAVVPAIVARGNALVERLADEIDEVGGLLERVLRREPLPPPPAAADEDALVAGLERVQPALVEAFRGTEEEIHHRLDHWLPRLREHAPVLDLGCGRGELLVMLREAGVAATGVEGDAALAQSARRRGLEVLVGDALEVLGRQPDAAWGAVTAIHLAEHLAPATLLALLAEVRRVLRPGGLLVVESPDPRSLRVGAALYWIDPTHRRPLMPETVRLFCTVSGLEVIAEERLHPFPPEERVRPPEPFPEGAGEDELAVRLDRLEGRLDDLLTGPRDFALVVRRPAAESPP